MINKKEKIVWILYAAILVFLFLLSSTDLIIKEQKNEVYRLSVIIEDSRDENYINFRKGMDQAAMDLNADVSFITLYEKNNQEQQVELMLRERQDGVQALIISPVDEESMINALDENQMHLPVVFLNTDTTGGQASAAVSPDYIDMGRQLAGEIGRRYTTDVPVYLFGECGRSRIARMFEQGIQTDLEMMGYEVSLFEKQQDGDFGREIEKLVYPGCQNSIIVALDQAALVETAAVLADNEVYASYVEGLYGRGTSMQILNYLERGQITGICVSDDYAAGYRCVSSAVDLIQNRTPESEYIRQQSFYIEKADLRKKEFEKMLYPIE